MPVSLPVAHSAVLCALTVGLHLKSWFLEGRASARQQVFRKHLLCALGKCLQLCEAKACGDEEMGLCEGCGAPCSHPPSLEGEEAFRPPVVSGRAGCAI